MTDIEFKDFGKIARFRTLEADITEKIDGTNAQIYVPEDANEPVLAGSRNKWITPEQDNYGFARFVYENERILRLLGPGRHFGEWYGSGIQRRYGLDHKRFALFNVDRYAEGLPTELVEWFSGSGQVHLVPVLYRGPVDTGAIAAVAEKLYAEGSVAVPGWNKPEGVIIQVGGQRWKITDNGDAHKGASTTHREAVMSAAAEDKARREASESAFDRALRATEVTRLDDGQFSITHGAYSEMCDQSEIRATRIRVAQMFVESYQEPKAA